ncbi:MAG: Ig-like domain-containing protein, partial [Clostridia bacterium]
DKITAEDNFNYILDSELGYAAKATLDSTGRVVTLLTANHSNGKLYSITVENVMDMFGNVISSDSKLRTKKFVGISSSGSTSALLGLETVVTVNVNTIDFIFSAELTADELEAMRIKVSVPEEYTHTLPSSLTSHIYFVGDKKNIRVQYESNTSKNPELFKSGNIYEVVVTGIDRLNSKDEANIKMFAGTGTPNSAPEVLSVVAVNSTAVEVVFNEPVKGITKSQFDIKGNTSLSISDVSVKSADEIADKVTLYLSSSSKLSDSGYKLYVRSGVKDAAGLNSVIAGTGTSSSYFEFDGTSVVNEAPFVETDITVLDTYTLQFAFNEPIKSVTTGSFSIKRTSGSGTTNFIISNALLSDDKKTVTLYLNSKYSALDSDYGYELTINSSVADMQSLAVASENRKLQFTGVDNDPEDLEVAASYINGDNNKITLLFSKELDVDSLAVSDFEFFGAGYYKSTSDKVEFDEKSVTITLDNELKIGETLTIKITSGGRSKIMDYNSQKLITEELGIETN